MINYSTGIFTLPENTGKTHPKAPVSVGTKRARTVRIWLRTNLFFSNSIFNNTCLELQHVFSFVLHHTSMITTYYIFTNPGDVLNPTWSEGFLLHHHSPAAPVSPPSNMRLLSAAEVRKALQTCACASFPSALTCWYRRRIWLRTNLFFSNSMLSLPRPPPRLELLRELMQTEVSPSSSILDLGRACLVSVVCLTR